jgi:transcriptional regulator with XRE-family HTH domain
MELAFSSVNQSAGIFVMGSAFAQWLAINREARGLSQNALAQAAKVDASSISKYEAGLLSPRRSTVKKIGAAMKLDDNAVNGGLQAAGFMPDATQEIVAEPDPDLAVIIENYSGLSPDNKKLARTVIEQFRRSESSSPTRITEGLGLTPRKKTRTRKDG